MAVHSSCLFAVGNDTEMNGTNQSELDEVWRDNEGHCYCTVLARGFSVIFANCEMTIEHDMVFGCFLT